MKLPNLKGLKRGTGDGNTGAPQILADLYRDLRDRHLLPVVILLVVGIVAVPLVLGGSSEEPQPPGPSAAQLSSELALQSEPAVLVESTGVRDYRQRLRVFRQKNPFRQQLTHAAVSTAKVQSLSNDVSQTLSALDTSGTGSLSDAASATPTGVNTDTSLPGVPSSGGNGGGGSGNQSPSYFEYRVDIEFNAQSQKKNLRRGVKKLVLLPSADRPVISFIGATEGGKEAVFLVSPDAGVQGGNCVPSPDNCFFLKLTTRTDEDLAFLDYTDPDTNDHTTYRLRLVDIRRIQV